MAGGVGREVDDARGRERRVGGDVDDLRAGGGDAARRDSGGTARASRFGWSKSGNSGGGDEEFGRRERFARGARKKRAQRAPRACPRSAAARSSPRPTRRARAAARRRRRRRRRRLRRRPRRRLRARAGRRRAGGPSAATARVRVPPQVVLERRAAAVVQHVARAAVHAAAPASLARTCGRRGGRGAGERAEKREGCFSRIFFSVTNLSKFENLLEERERERLCILLGEVPPRSARAQRARFPGASARRARRRGVARTAFATSALAGSARKAATDATRSPCDAARRAGSWKKSSVGMSLSSSISISK